MIWTFDLGTKTGFAIYGQGKLQTSGTKDFKTKRIEGGGMKFLRFERWLDDLERTYGCPNEIYFEEVRRHSGVLAGHVFGGYLAILTKWAEEKVVPHSGIPVGAIKKNITGNGAASKGKVMNAVTTRYGLFAEDDNHADALAILAYAEDVLQAL